MADEIVASEELLAVATGPFIQSLGIAVAEANRAIRGEEGADDDDLLFTINEAEIEVNVAISVEKGSTLEAGGSLGFSVFSVNASYARTYNFKEEASSKIKVKLAARPRSTTA